MFRLYGNKIEIYRYRVTNLETNEVYLSPTLEEVEQYGTPTPIDTTEIEWLDGIEVEEDGDTCAKATAIFNMGRQAYFEMLAKPSQEDVNKAQQEKIDQLTLLVAMQGGAVIG